MNTLGCTSANMQDGSASHRQAMLSRLDRELAIGGVKSRIRINSQKASPAPRYRSSRSGEGKEHRVFSEVKRQSALIFSRFRLADRRRPFITDLCNLLEDRSCPHSALCPAEHCF